ncbi:hypothetical protein [Idiomarina ramblicola]|uniref:Uncharacterized protein n=1 Tax=Idiomarina ramblicola TaxID=263724 RepID=A0A432Z1L8_9GAMM|nr:hypothetical protein [Idiomarina ramblicola]RUO71771.1 hypothetical protein CWI78_04445 [Idiomarina ramblicola]
MNREGFQQLQDLEALLKKGLQRLDEQTKQFESNWHTLTDSYEGEGAEEAEELHLQASNNLSSYLQQLEHLVKITADELG